MADVPLEQQLGEELTGRRLTIAAAESCTGGLVSARITSIAGSSTYFLGGIVAYSNGVKQSLLGVPADVLERCGAVSHECALEMARGARRATGADIGISTTGIAGPGGATPTKPVGLVYIGCVTSEGEWCQMQQWTGDRAENVAWSAEAALALVLDRLREQNTMQSAVE